MSFVAKEKESEFLQNFDRNLSFLRFKKREKKHIGAVKVKLGIKARLGLTKIFAVCVSPPPVPKKKKNLWPFFVAMKTN